MVKNNAAIAETYYNIMNKKDVESLAKYLDPNVRFISPLSQYEGKNKVLEATREFVNFINALTIRTKFSSEDQAMIVYDVDAPPPIGKIRSASLLSFQNGLIAKIELFFDARPFEKK